jgi:hypothetical protein
VRKDVNKPDWLVFDDESVEETNSDVVGSRLKGGGDDFMSCAWRGHRRCARARARARARGACDR